MKTVVHLLMDWLRECPNAPRIRDLTFLYGKLIQVCKLEPIPAIGEISQYYGDLSRHSSGWPLGQMIRFELECSPSWWESFRIGPKTHWGRLLGLRWSSGQLRLRIATFRNYWVDTYYVLESGFELEYPHMVDWSLIEIQGEPPPDLQAKYCFVSAAIQPGYHAQKHYTAMREIAAQLSHHLNTGFALHRH